MKNRLLTTLAQGAAATVLTMLPTVALADSAYPPIRGCYDDMEGKRCDAIVEMNVVEGRCVKRVGVVKGQQEPVARLECIPLSQLKGKAQQEPAQGKPDQGKPDQSKPAQGKPPAPGHAKRPTPSQDKPVAAKGSDDCSVGSGPTSLVLVAGVLLWLLARRGRSTARGRANIRG